MPSASGYGPEQYYGEDEDYMTNPATLDMAEKEELIRNNQTKIYDLQKELTRQQQEAEAARVEAEKQASEKRIQEMVSTKAAV